LSFTKKRLQIETGQWAMLCFAFALVSKALEHVISRGLDSKGLR